MRNGEGMAIVLEKEEAFYNPKSPPTRKYISSSVYGSITMYSIPQSALLEFCDNDFLPPLRSRNSVRLCGKRRPQTYFSVQNQFPSPQAKLQDYAVSPCLLCSHCIITIAQGGKQKGIMLIIWKQTAVLHCYIEKLLFLF